MAFACVPCVVIPLLLIIWKFIEPYVLRIWNPFAKKGETDTNKPKDITECSLFASCPCIKKNKNDEVTETKEELVDVDDKKSN